LATPYFGALDGLRCLSIAAVIWHHAAGWHLAGLLGRGHDGVMLFFAISGFLITTLLLRERDRTGRIRLGAFYRRRTLRIFPLYYAVLGLYLLLVLSLERHAPAGEQFLHNLPSFLTYTSNWFVDAHGQTRVIFYFAWSLATEEQFYLFWPSVLRWTRSWQVPAAVMVGLIVVQALGDPSGLGTRIAGSIATPICLGCLGAQVLHHPRGFAWAAPFVAQRWSGVLWSSALVACLASRAPDAAAFPFMTGWVLSSAARADGMLSSVLAHPIARYVGSISYGMYLLHMFALNAVKRAWPGAGEFAAFAGTLALSVAFAALSHRFFERPLMAWRGSTALNGQGALPALR